MLTDGSYEGSFLRHLRYVRQLKFAPVRNRRYVRQCINGHSSDYALAY